MIRYDLGFVWSRSFVVIRQTRALSLELFVVRFNRVVGLLYKPARRPRPHFYLFFYIFVLALLLSLPTDRLRQASEGGARELSDIALPYSLEKVY